MAIFGGLKGFGQMFDGKPGSPIEDFLRKNNLMGMQPRFDSLGSITKGAGDMSPAAPPSPGMLPNIRDEMIRRNMASAPQFGAPIPGGTPPSHGAGMRPGGGLADLWARISAGRFSGGF